MPSLVTDYIKSNWEHFSKKDRALFIRDTEQALKDNYEGLFEIGGECDVDTYERFLKWIEEKEKK